MIYTFYYIVLTFILSIAIWTGITTIVVRKLNKRINNLQEIIEYSPRCQKILEDPSRNVSKNNFICYNISN